jgi:hypothetical protein
LEILISSPSARTRPSRAVFGSPCFCGIFHLGGRLRPCAKFPTCDAGFVHDVKERVDDLGRLGQVNIETVVEGSVAD